MKVVSFWIVLVSMLAQGLEPTCIATGGVDASERAALTRICGETLGQLAGLLREPVGPVELEVNDELHAIDAFVRDGVLVVPWPSRARWQAASDALGLGHGTTRVGEWADGNLRHELAHFIWHTTIYGDSIPVAPDEYGTVLPDWLEEAVAISAEPAESRRQRIDRLLELDLDSIPALTDVLTAHHPNAGKAARSPFTRTVTKISHGWTPGSPDSVMTITRVRYRIEADGRVTLDTTRFQSLPQSSVIDLYFYPLSYAALAYFREIGGDAVISRLVARSKRGARGYDYALGIPGIPSTPAALNAAWRRWLERRLSDLAR